MVHLKLKTVGPSVGCDVKDVQRQPIKRAVWLVVVAVVGNRSSCLPHTSLIVPWPVPSCQLQPAPALESQRKRMKEEQAAARGRGWKQTIKLREKREMMDSAS